MNMKFELSGSKGLVALLLMSALVSTSVMASLVKQSRVDCGVREQESSTDSAFCSYSDTQSAIGSSPEFDFNITATAATGYVFGGLRTSGDIVFDGLLRGRVGAYGPYYSAGTFALVQYIDSFLFSFSNVAPGETLTMKTITRFHGNNYEYVDESLFYDGNIASMQSEYSIGGFGVPSVNQMASFLDIRDGLVTSLGSSDTNIFTKLLTVDVNSAFRTSISQTLSTTLYFNNGFIGSVGVGSGAFGADFSSTAGVLSIEFFDSQNKLVDYQLTTDTGLFSFLRAAPPVSSVPAPSTISMMLLGLCALMGLKRRRLTVSAAARTS
jgi:hypothetical protein